MRLFHLGRLVRFLRISFGKGLDETKSCPSEKSPVHLERFFPWVRLISTEQLADGGPVRLAGNKASPPGHDVGSRLRSLSVRVRVICFNRLQWLVGFAEIVKKVKELSPVLG